MCWKTPETPVESSNESTQTMFTYQRCPSISRYKNKTINAVSSENMSNRGVQAIMGRLFRLAPLVETMDCIVWNAIK